jgi:hypothetical protein
MFGRIVWFDYHDHFVGSLSSTHVGRGWTKSLLHFIGEGKWSDEKVLAKARESVATGRAARCDRGSFAMALY